VRLGTRSSNEFIQYLNKKNDEIQQIFLSKIIDLIKTVNVKVMLGDSTITEQKTFDPKRVNDFYQKIIKNLKDWSIQDVSISNNDDIRRIFTKFEVREGNYLISGHMSIQYHVLLYYKPDQRVIEAQKELSDIIDLTKNKEKQMSDNSDQFVLDRLKEKGYKDFDHQKLFEIFYENDEFREKIYKEIQNEIEVDFQELSIKKNKLIKELDNLLVETYQTSPVLIDDTRLITGEEGCLCTFDIEFIKNKTKEGLFDPRKISETIKEKIVKRLDEFSHILES
jgi:MinD-like ATPase involved in chromosome partitioning or flagellar assembly